MFTFTKSYKNKLNFEYTTESFDKAQDKPSGSSRKYGTGCTRRFPENTGQAPRDGLSCKCNSVKEIYPLFFKRCKVMVVPKIGLYSRFLIFFLVFVNAKHLCYCPTPFTCSATSVGVVLINLRLQIQ